MLQSTAQTLDVQNAPHLPVGEAHIVLAPIEVSEEHPHEIEVEEPGQLGEVELVLLDEDHADDLSVEDLTVNDLPGAPPGTQHPAIEVFEASDAAPVVDENDAKKSKKNESWDWESHGSKGFVAWVKHKLDTVPKHSGYDTAGLERAVSYLERLDNEISKAMRLDLDGELDANKIEHVRAEIDHGIELLHERLDKVKQSKKSKNKRKKSSAQLSDGLVKEAQKITGVQGIYVTVPLLISRVARVCINGTVSSGHDIEDLYSRQVKKYKLTDREQAETMQLLADMGYPLRQDRGFMPNEDIDAADSDNMDWAANYKG